MKKIGDLLRDYMRERGWLAGNPYDPLFKEWRKIAGEAVASHARLVDIQNGILLVEVDHPGWLQMIQLRSTALLAAARATVPLVVIEGLRVRLAAAPPSSSEKDH